MSIMGLLKSLRSATHRHDFATGWNDRIDPIDRSLIDSSRIVNINALENARFAINQEAIEEEERKDKRETRRPVEVVGEILAEKPTFKMSDLKMQIKVIKNRIKVLREQGVAKGNLEDEHHALDFLEARLKYPKTHELFKWTTTNQDKIKSLLSKYKLHMVEMKSDGSGVKNIPLEAIDEIEKFAKAYRKVSKKMPQFRLIVDEPTYKAMIAKQKSKDPILLALSPFGNWYYILGAWDKEVEYVDDLIYNGK